MNNLDLGQPKRQSLVGVLVIFMKNLRIAINVFIGVIAVQFGTKFSLLGVDIKTLGVLVVLVFLVISYLQYLRFFFYARGDKFIIEKGLISRDRITIPFDRIQTVHINQNVIQQVLGVVALKIDTAGSAQKELEIAALEKSYARALQDYLIEKKEEALPGGEQQAEGEGRDEEKPQSVAKRNFAGKEPLVKLSFKDLILIGLTENHLRNGLILFAIINGYLWQFEEYLEPYFDPEIKNQAVQYIAQALVIIPIAILIFLVISVFFSLIQSMLRYFELKFFVDRRGVMLVSGLLKRAEYQIPVNKIQYLKWKSNPLRRLIGLKTLVIKQASTDEVGDRRSVSIPGVRQQQMEAVLEEFYPERKTYSFIFLKPNRLLFVQLSAWLVLIPSLALTYLANYSWYYLLPAGIYFAGGLLVAYKYYRSVTVGVNKEMILIRKGWLTPSWLAVKFYKMQNAALHQSVFQKRRGLASITLYTAAGDESIPHLPLEEARALYNYLLYKIESSQESWM